MPIRNRAAGTGTSCPEPERSQSRLNILLGAGAGAADHNEPHGWLQSLRLCGQTDDNVGKKSRKESDTTTRRPTVAPATETNWAPSCTTKLAQPRQSGVRYSFYEIYGVVFTGLSGAVGMSPPSCAGDPPSIPWLSPAIGTGREFRNGTLVIRGCLWHWSM